MKTEEKGKLVQMRLSQETLDRIDRLNVLLNYGGSKAGLIKEFLKFSEELIINIRNGNKVYIEKNDGTYLITLPNL